MRLGLCAELKRLWTRLVMKTVLPERLRPVTASQTVAPPASSPKLSRSDAWAKIGGSQLKFTMDGISHPLGRHGSRHNAFRREPTAPREVGLKSGFRKWKGGRRPTDVAARGKCGHDGRPVTPPVQGDTNASPRTSGLFADRSPAAAAVSARSPLGRVATDRARRVGFVASDGADGDLAAARGAAIARSAELELARIWHARGVLAAQENARAASHFPTVTLNAKVCETYPQVIKACIDNGWELNAHNYDQVPMHKLDDQRATIKKSMDILEKFSGR